ncbi:MAG: type III-B CRISPR-associated protein Cas10/Cmr2 [Nodosilinea sp.]
MADSTLFWQAKIWGLLHDSPLKPLQRSKRGDGPWNDLVAMNGWKQFTESPTGKFTWIKQADFIASASDRAAIGSLSDWSNINYEDGLEIRHLLSGQKLKFKLPQNSQLHSWRELPGDQGRGDERKYINQIVLDAIPEHIRISGDHQKVFWWLWRCLPEALSQNLAVTAPNLSLIPAETRIPDCSIWSHNGTVAALAGSLMGYNGSCDSRPYVVTFTFTPVQEVVKASRKMQDFWAGSWILHYLSARICWAFAEEYGPDSLVYPSLYSQPLIDYWLLTKKYPEWQQDKLIELPSTRQLLTAGFPNVLVIVLPESKVKSATDLARRLLTGESPEISSPWLGLAEQVKREVFGNAPIDPSVWEEWLKAQWQIYWTALPLGDKKEDLARPTVEEFEAWQSKQNKFTGLSPEQIFEKSEGIFVKQKISEASKSDESDKNKFLNVNVGSWWAPVFDQTRNSLAAVKNARVWSLPTAFGSRSTISGIGSVVRREAKNDWVYSDEANDSPLNRFWEKQRGLFDGKEQLNATEVVKRGIKKVLPDLLSLPSSSIPTYPDLTVGVAGWLKQEPQQIAKYQDVCEKVLNSFAWAKEAGQEPWGIPWVDENQERCDWGHPRLMNPGWLIDDYIPELPDILRPLTKREKQNKTNAESSKLRDFISKNFSKGNPTDWYVLASGDGDDMGEWLKGTKMQPYQEYICSNFHKRTPPTQEEAKALDEFLDQPKRMGPATHVALSRALLDFSNQLVPYLTEQRYAGRLIYAGGDDVLAYTNLWEWDQWLWDIRQCFRGDKDPHDEFDETGNYWQWQKPDTLREDVAARPLFTMGGNASISFGIVIAHHSVPLAIALENLWEAEREGAKKHQAPDGAKKDAVQVRVLYGNGNQLKSTAKFEVFNQWKALLNLGQKHNNIDFDPALFEQAAEVWSQHPAPLLNDPSHAYEAILPWVRAFCARRDLFNGDDKESAKADFQAALAAYLQALCATTSASEQDREVKNWLKLAAFVLRKRDIKIGGAP